MHMPPGGVLAAVPSVSIDGAVYVDIEQHIEHALRTHVCSGSIWCMSMDLFVKQTDLLCSRSVVLLD